MNRKVFLLLLTILSVIKVSTSSNAITTASRDFWSAYFGVIKGKEFIMDVDCLGGKYDEYFTDLQTALLSMDFVKILFDLDMILNLEVEKCPLAEYNRIIKDLKISFRNGTLMKNVLRNFAFIQSKIEKYMESDRSACATGSCVGEITKIAIYGMGYTSWQDPHSILRTTSSFNK